MKKTLLTPYMVFLMCLGLGFPQPIHGLRPIAPSESGLNTQLQASLSEQVGQEESLTTFVPYNPATTSATSVVPLRNLPEVTFAEVALLKTFLHGHDFLALLGLSDNEDAPRVPFEMAIHPREIDAFQNFIWVLSQTHNTTDAETITRHAIQALQTREYTSLRSREGTTANAIFRLSSNGFRHLTMLEDHRAASVIQDRLNHITTPPSIWVNILELLVTRVLNDNQPRTVQGPQRKAFIPVIKQLDFPVDRIPNEGLTFWIPDNNTTIRFEWMDPTRQLWRIMHPASGTELHRSTRVDLFAMDTTRGEGSAGIRNQTPVIPIMKLPAQNTAEGPTLSLSMEVMPQGELGENTPVLRTQLYQENPNDNPRGIFLALADMQTDYGSENTPPALDATNYELGAYQILQNTLGIPLQQWLDNFTLDDVMVLSGHSPEEMVPWLSFYAQVLGVRISQEQLLAAGTALSPYLADALQEQQDTNNSVNAFVDDGFTMIGEESRSPSHLIRLIRWIQDKGYRLLDALPPNNFIRFGFNNFIEPATHTGDHATLITWVVGSVQDVFRETAQRNGHSLGNPFLPEYVIPPSFESFLTHIDPLPEEMVATDDFLRFPRALKARLQSYQQHFWPRVRVAQVTFHDRKAEHAWVLVGTGNHRRSLSAFAADVGHEVGHALLEPIDTADWSQSIVPGYGIGYGDWITEALRILTSKRVAQQTQSPDVHPSSAAGPAVTEWLYQRGRQLAQQNSKTWHGAFKPLHQLPDKRVPYAYGIVIAGIADGLADQVEDPGTQAHYQAAVGFLAEYATGPHHNTASTWARKTFLRVTPAGKTKPTPQLRGLASAAKTFLREQRPTYRQQPDLRQIRGPRGVGRAIGPNHHMGLEEVDTTEIAPLHYQSTERFPGPDGTRIPFEVRGLTYSGNLPDTHFLGYYRPSKTDPVNLEVELYLKPQDNGKGVIAGIRHHRGVETAMDEGFGTIVKFPNTLYVDLNPANGRIRLVRYSERSRNFWVLEISRTGQLRQQDLKSVRHEFAGTPLNPTGLPGRLVIGDIIFPVKPAHTRALLTHPKNRSFFHLTNQHGITHNSVRGQTLFGIEAPHEPRAIETTASEPMFLTLNRSGNLLVHARASGHFHAFGSTSGSHLKTSALMGESIAGIGITADDQLIIASNDRQTGTGYLRKTPPTLNENLVHATKTPIPLTANSFGKYTGIQSIAVHPNGKQMAVVTIGQQARILDTTDFSVTAIFPSAETRYAVSPSASIALFDPRQNRLITGNREGTLAYWDIATQRLLRSVQGHNAAITALAFSDSGKYLASGDQAGQVVLWDALTGERLADTAEPGAGYAARAVTALQFTFDGRYLINGGEKTSLDLWLLPLPAPRQPKYIRKLALVSTSSDFIGAFEHSLKRWTFSPNGTEVILLKPDAINRETLLSGNVDAVLLDTRDQARPDKLIAAINPLAGTGLTGTPKQPILPLVALTESETTLPTRFREKGRLLHQAKSSELATTAQDALIFSWLEQLNTQVGLEQAPEALKDTARQQRTDTRLTGAPTTLPVNLPPVDGRAAGRLNALYFGETLATPTDVQDQLAPIGLIASDPKGWAMATALTRMHGGIPVVFIVQSEREQQHIEALDVPLKQVFLKPEGMSLEQATAIAQSNYLSQTWGINNPNNIYHLGDAEDQTSPQALFDDLGIILDLEMWVQLERLIEALYLSLQA